MRLVALLLLAAFPAIAAPPRTFRVDYFHTGSDGKEIFSLDRLVVEPLPWPGNPARPIDDTDSGKYRFLVRDATNKTLLYSRGFSSIFGEWEDTQDAKERARTFEESFRFPLPAGPVEVTLEKRDRANAFVPVWTFKVDPKDQTVSDAVPDSPGPLIPLLKSGPSESKVDLLILGDGYTKAQRGKFEKDAKRLVSILFSQSPFKERKQDFNVWGLCPESRESGISRPSTGVHRRSRIVAGSRFGASKKAPLGAHVPAHLVAQLRCSCDAHRVGVRRSWRGSASAVRASHASVRGRTRTEPTRNGARSRSAHAIRSRNALRRDDSCDLPRARAMLRDAHVRAWHETHRRRRRARASRDFASRSRSRRH